MTGYSASAGRGNKPDAERVGSDPSNERYPRAARLRRPKDIRHVLRHGRRVRTGPIDVFVAASRAGHSRVGVIVPRYRHTIVERNRLKRRLREIVRREWLPLARSHGTRLDVVMKACPAAYEVAFPALLGTLRETFVSLC